MERDKYYVEFSVKQGCFHIDTLERIKKANINLCVRRISNGYVIVGGPFTYSEAYDFMEKVAFLKKKESYAR